MLKLDETLQRRVQEAKAAREVVLIEIAGVRHRETLPSTQVLPSQVEKFSAIFRKKLVDRSSTFAKGHLRAVVDEVVVRDQTAMISGSHLLLLLAISDKKGKPDQVPSLMCTGSLHDQSYDSASSILNMSPPDKGKTDLPADPFLVCLQTSRPIMRQPRPLCCWP